METIVKFLFDYVRELYAKHEALRIIVEKNGLLDRSEYQRAYESALKVYDESVHAELQRAVDAAFAEVDQAVGQQKQAAEEDRQRRMMDMLLNHDGPKQ